MKNLLKPINLFILLLSLISTVNSYAIEFPEKPDNANFYIDKAGIINAEAATQINQLASKLLQEEQVALFVVTLTSLADYDAAGYSIEGYAADLFDEWGIGFDDRNYGMLFLISKGDRKARIELGADWDRSYDRTAKEIMDSLIIPAFKNNDYPTGVVDGVKGLDAMARGLNLPKPEAPWWFLPAIILAVILFIAIIINLFKTGRSGWAWALIAFLGLLIFAILRSSANSGGSSGGFGGGHSGGGGASGSW